MKIRLLMCIFLCIISALPVAAQDEYLASLDRGDDITLHIESFAYQETAGRFTPANGIYLVVLFTIDNQSGDSVCILASNIRLLYDDEEYPPERALMGAVQRELDPRRDYVGPVSGHCVEAGDTEPSFAAFDVPDDMQEFTIRFDAVAQDFADLEPVGEPQEFTPEPLPTRPAVTASQPPSESRDQEDANALADGLFILAGGRDIERVVITNGRPNGGERGAIITYLVQDSDPEEMVNELLDILEATAASIRSNDLDLDAVTLILGNALGDGIGIIVTSVPDLLDFYEGRITRGEYFDLLTVTDLTD